MQKQLHCFSETRDDDATSDVYSAHPLPSKIRKNFLAQSQNENKTHVYYI